MILISQQRSSILGYLGSKLFGWKIARPSVPTEVDEHEVYLQGLWDETTSHAPVEFTKVSPRRHRPLGR